MVDDSMTTKNRSLNRNQDAEEEDDWRYTMVDKVLYRASLLAVFIYALVGVFGYLTFATSKETTYKQL